MLTTLRRLALVLFVFLAWTPAAYAWSWPVQGPVLRPFAYDEAHPYAPGQHRGVDIGAESAGETVVAPAAGTVSFAGTVPTNGRSVTIETADGYSVTLTHLGSVGVAKGATVAEEDAIGTVGPSGTPEVDGQYMHLGIRVTADPNGYVDPLGLLPPASGSGADDTGSTTSQPASSGASSAPPASKPSSSAPRSPRVAATGEGNVRTHDHKRAQESDSDAPTTRSRQRPVRAKEEERPRTRQNRANGPTSSSRRPVVEPAALRPIGLDAGHAIRPSGTALSVDPTRRPGPAVLVPALCNGLPTLLALATALMAARTRRRRRAGATAGAVAQVLHLPPPAVDRRRAPRAA